MGRKWADVDAAAGRKNTAAVIDAALEQGITLFDHADIYAEGHSETLFGAVLRANPTLRDGMVLQTKCGVRFEDTPEPGTPGRYDFSYDHIVASAEASLQRLAIGPIDILLLHRPDALMEPDEVARAFDHLRSSGKVRYFGVSNFSPAQLDLLQRSCDEPLVVNQLQLSLTHHGLIDEGVAFNQHRYGHTETTGALDFCRARGIRVQPWSPLDRGRMFHPPADAPERAHALAAHIAAVATEYEKSPEAIALAWLLRHPAGLQPIVGTTDLARIAMLGDADAVEMTRETWYSLFNTARGAPVP
jgi:predicted oxidoreductase